jgi:hypothetical protein
MTFQKYHKYKYILIPIAVLLWFIQVNCAKAARIFPELSTFIESGKKVYQLSLFINTESESLNVIKGRLSFSFDNFSFVRQNRGGSIANLWLKSPTLVSQGEIEFIGGIPNGFNGERGYLFSEIFAPNTNTNNRQQLMDIGIRDLSVFLNDGKGTEKILGDEQFPLKLDEAQKGDLFPDNDPPEVFAPYVTKDLNLEKGKWVVIFYAQDKGLGVDYYEVFESPVRHNPEEMENEDIDWKIPTYGNIYILKDQDLKSYIYVKAVDMAGNARIAEVVPASGERLGASRYKILAVLAIFVFALSGIFILSLKIRRNRKATKNKRH